MDTTYHTTSTSALSCLGDLANHFAGKHIVITGAGGFLGSQFVHLFLTMNEVLEVNCKVTAYDNLMRGKPKWLDQLNTRDDFDFIEQDVIEPVNFGHCDYIIHAASIASPIFYRKYPLETMDVNVNGTRNILDAARQNSVLGILFLSSSEVYGNPPADQIPTRESFPGLVSSTGPRACYDESKRYGETLCVNYFLQYGVPVRIVRPFNVYGVGLHPEDGRVISDFYRDLISSGSVKLLSDGNATRTFCYISDAMNGFIRALVLGKDGEVYNIGNDHPEISMSDLAAKVLQSAGSESEIIYAISDDPEYLTDNPSRRCPDISKARTELGYEPETSLEEGLRLTYSYYKEIL